MGSLCYTCRIEGVICSGDDEVRVRFIRSFQFFIEFDKINVL